MISVNQSRRVAVSILLSVTLAYILSSSYVGPNGGQVWRQADVYAHILGFTGLKGFVPFEDFLGQRSVYDIPIYEYLIAKIALLIHADVLVVTRYFNVLLWLLTAYAGWRIVETLRKGSGIILLFLLSTSPLLLHYFSVPLPDAMALAFSLLAIARLMQDQLDGWSAALACTFFGVAALIKSPVPFVVIVFYLTYLGGSILARREDAFRSIRYHWRYISGPLLTALVCAVLAELLRNEILGQQLVQFAQDPNWYFGTLEMRLSKDLWVSAFERFEGASPRFLGYAYVALLFLTMHPALKVDRLATLAGLAAYVSGWLTFETLYRVHDYHQLSGTLLVFVAVANAGRGLWEFITARMPPLAIRRLPAIDYEHVLLLGLVIAAIGANLVTRGLSEFQRASIYDALEHALRNEARFLYVDDDVNFNDNVGPAIGGWVKTRFEQVNHAEFERECDRCVLNLTLFS
jgi:hypothetical protein